MVRLGKLIRNALYPYRISDAEEIEEIRRFFDGTPQGFFVDVGANRAGRITIDLERRGWNGLLIEPLPDLVDDLRKNRKATVVQSLVGSPAEAGNVMDFYRNEDTGGSTLHPNAELKDYAYPDVLRLQVRTLDSILQENDVPQPLDFLKVDVEFHELPVMQGLSFEKWRPRLIFIEDHGYGFALHRYIKSQSYKFYKKTQYNTWYVPLHSPLRATPMMHFAYFQKHFVGIIPRLLKHRIKSVYRRIMKR